ncbi:hypothetical protein [Sinomicrobium soli]|uniref:hypothetical protein n=1 Tax=Sinomicrobium sp. N-1-3-6 TaxID=2219864 RepID=UPI0011BE899A|nr:hypothetical protein [Sinomicrobium sp. N-1-3-6]
MKALRVHISISLIGAVLFSILYHAFHTIDHASQLPPVPAEKQAALQHTADKCPVCDFKLSVFETPGILDFTPVDTIVPTEHPALCTSPDLSVNNSVDSLRAPPVLLS